MEPHPRTASPGGQQGPASAPEPLQREVTASEASEAALQSQPLQPAAGRRQPHQTTATNPSSISVVVQRPPLEFQTPTVGLPQLLQPVVGSPKPLQPAASADKPLQPAASADESLQPAASADESLQPAARADESLQPPASAGESLQPTASADQSLQRDAGPQPPLPPAASPTSQPVQPGPSPTQLPHPLASPLQPWQPGVSVSIALQRTPPAAATAKLPPAPGAPALSPKRARARLGAKRLLVAMAALLACAPAMWLTAGRHLAVGAARRVSVSVNFAALIDWDPPRAGGEAAAAAPSCSQALGIQTVALMFLTMGPIPHERTWRLWLQGAAGWLPYQGLPAAKGAACSATGERWERTVDACAEAHGQQQLYKLYVHALPNFTGYDPASVFHGRLIPFRVVTQWGDMSLVVAERLLLRAALQDPANSRFLLLSDSGVPLYDPLTFYQQLMHEDRSRVKTCRDGYLSDYRWHPVMALKGVRRSQWRKSSQWFGMTREHAEVVVADEKLFAIFTKYCNGIDQRRDVECYPDEHYIPTLLSYRGLENETYCHGYGLAATNWSAGGPHPRSWRSREIKPWLMHSLRLTGYPHVLQRCDNTTIVEDSQRMFMPLRPALEAPTQQEACQLLHDGGRDLTATYERPLSGDCPLTARKFPKFTTVAVHSLFKRTCLGGSLTGNCTGIKAAAVLYQPPTPTVTAAPAGRRVVV